VLGAGSLIAAPGTQPLSRVSFVWTPGQIELPVRVDDTPATFLLDTAAEYSVVSARLAQLLKLTTERSRGRDFADDVALRVGGVGLEHQRVMVLPFDAYSARGRNIDGLLGYDLFSRFVTAIDFNARTVSLWTRSSFRPPSAAIVVPIAFAGRLPVVSSTVTLAGKRALPARLVLDTGASQAVILRYPFANENGLLDLAGNQDAHTTRAPSLASGELLLVDVPVEQVSLGPLTFDRPPVQAHREPGGSGAITASDGVLGNALLARYTLIVDYPHKRLFFQPLRRAR
jgi:hypothetical protein